MNDLLVAALVDSDYYCYFPTKQLCISNLQSEHSEHVEWKNIFVLEKNISNG